ncbi:hypothetical protein [Nocardia colli]|uniref:hypothetical protein n=1 Tax=Nocardia colli TaxID=2545717 RepID=UPI0035DA31DF
MDQTEGVEEFERSGDPDDRGVVASPACRAPSATTQQWPQPFTAVEEFAQQIDEQKQRRCLRRRCFVFQKFMNYRIGSRAITGHCRGYRGRGPGGRHHYFVFAEVFRIHCRRIARTDCPIGGV